MTNPNEPINPITHHDGELIDATSLANMSSRCIGLTKLEQFTSLNVAAMVGSIKDEECYQRLKKLAEKEKLTVSQWIARDAVKQAKATIEVLNETTLYSQDEVDEIFRAAQNQIKI